MEDIAGWIASIATMIAAMMTAANLGAKVTGSGFLVFTIGSICWSLVGLSTGQTNLLATNGFLTVVNMVGAWRWLGEQRRYEEGGKSADRASRRCRAMSFSPRPVLPAWRSMTATDGVSDARSKPWSSPPRRG
ncbi:PRC-barrel [Novosphingobium lubricantis]|uniref:PRC-barrel n=1 Tax=Novosphingobium pentaromativorans US6-1 TaxID=1088721 RepID=G6EJR8_9SPHN|nr:hypothetical protein [Sphingomonas sp. SRS2]EHJ58452.1 PRC-barrel [Novosphingobium pentaromativorans US6-1]